MLKRLRIFAYVVLAATFLLICLINPIKLSKQPAQAQQQALVLSVM